MIPGKDQPFTPGSSRSLNTLNHFLSQTCFQSQSTVCWATEAADDDLFWFWLESLLRLHGKCNIFLKKKTEQKNSRTMFQSFVLQYIYYRVLMMNWGVSQLEGWSCSVVWWCGGGYFWICQISAGWTHCGWGGCCLLVSFWALCRHLTSPILLTLCRWSQWCSGQLSL